MTAAPAMRPTLRQIILVDSVPNVILLTVGRGLDLPIMVKQTASHAIQETPRVVIIRVNVRIVMLQVSDG
ncbi:MAG: hypothetical protein A2029_10640 [Chloroflexi bacterium RBG_19FT_COMBO_47_9]|nr:MAG: hypothetical protein A2029_10640 [Chloroflexi bacterium RBG_19FT_COMBO_47_9]